MRNRVNWLFNDICKLDNEFLNNINNKANDDPYFFVRTFQKWPIIRNAANELSLDEKKYLLCLIEDRINNSDNSVSTVMGIAYEAIYWMVDVEDKEQDLNNTVHI